MVSSCLYLYLSISIWVTTNKALYSSVLFFFSAWFHFFDSLILVGWVFSALQSVVRQHFIQNSLFVTVKDIEGNVS